MGNVVISPVKFKNESEISSSYCSFIGFGHKTMIDKNKQKKSIYMPLTAPNHIKNKSKLVKKNDINMILL